MLESKYVLNLDHSQNQVGEVQEIEGKFKLTVLADMFGRETPVEVEFDQIEKL